MLSKAALFICGLLIAPLAAGYWICWLAAKAEYDRPTVGEDTTPTKGTGSSECSP